MVGFLDIKYFIKNIAYLYGEGAGETVAAYLTSVCVDGVVRLTVVKWELQTLSKRVLQS